MKNLSTLSRVSLVAACLAFYSCENVGDDVQPDNSVVPAEFGIDIPSSISDTETIEVNRPGDNSNGRVAQSDNDLHGGHIYRHLRTYIHVGDKSAELVRDIMQSLRRNNINRAMAFTYKGDDDGRDKNLLVEENVAFEGRTWDYGLYVTDADSEGEADGGKAMQIFWNTSPVEGVAILNPYNLDRRNDRIYQATMYRIDYSEVGDQNYDKHMIVQISDLVLETGEVFAMDNLKMFVGQKGDVLDIYGNSSHPQAYIFTEETGYNWAFVASADRAGNFSVAEVALPFSSLNSTSRQVILEEYSLRNVFERELSAAYPNATQPQLDRALRNTTAPGFFARGDGFVAAGTAPDAKYNPLVERIQNLSPYNPKDVADMEVSFK